MSLTISGSTALSGLSGMDTNFDTTLEQLYSVERTQLTQLEAWKSDWQLRYDAFNTVIDQMSAAKNMLSAIGSVNSFVSKNAVSTDEKVLTALATGKATDGQHKIAVSQMASNAIWCNTGAVFENKTDFINTTGETVTFEFDYAGKRYRYGIAPNTTLESFVSLINNSSKNPGINVSLVNTGSGYVYQIAGKDTGASNSLTIYSCDLEGMNASGSTSVWSSDSPLNLTDAISDPTKYTYSVTLDSGKKVSFSIKGDATEEELCNAFNNAAGSGTIRAEIDPASKNLKVSGVRSITRSSDNVTAYTPGGLKLNVNANLDEAVLAEDSTESIAVTVTLAERGDDGNNLTRTFTIDGSTTRRDFVNQLKQSLQSSGKLGLQNNGVYSISLEGVDSIALDGGRSLADLGFGAETYASKGTLATTLTFDADKLAARIDGRGSGEAASALSYTLTLEDGSSLVVNTDEHGSALTSDMSNADLLAAVRHALSENGISVPDTTQDASGNSVQVLNGVRSMSLSSGTVASLGFSMASEPMGSSLVNASSTLTFDSEKLDARIDGASEGAGKNLRYTIVARDGTAYYVDTLEDGTTPLTSDKSNRELRDAIRKVLSDNGITVDLDDDTDPTTLTVEGVRSVFLSSGSNAASGFTAKTSSSLELDASGFYEVTDGSGSVISRTLERPRDLSYTVTLNDGTTHSISLTSGSSMDDILTALNNELAGTGAEASLVDSHGNAWVSEAVSGDAYLAVTNIQSLTGSQISGQVTASSNWSITNSSNAIYQVDNWPMAMQSESNTITDLLEGVSMTLQGVGEANLTVTTDVASVEQSIQNFLDAVNSVVMTIRDLTAVDEDKATTTNDPNNKGSSNYSKSTLTAEKGGLLTGNYGVQLVKSRFVACVTSTPPGFQSIASADDMLSGDVLSCLANMGIKTDTDTTSQTYGLFVISPRSDLLQQMDEDNYQDMINNHISDLVDFFVSSGTGTSTSSDFRYNSHIQGITEAGIYDVKYNVDSNGNITDVTIGGEKCIRDETKGGYYYTCASGAARGLAISIDDLTVGDHSGQVRIKQGLVQTVENFLAKELTFNDVNISTNAPDFVVSAQISLKSENGAMMTLKSNYSKIMENIDTSIEKEQRRLDTWYNRQKNIFANLETLLRELNDQQSALESQLGQLGG